MRAHIVSIGSELILGHLTDTNATFLAQELAALGIELLHVTQVGDDRARIARTITAAAADADVVVCSGGVGPTDDDLTREAIADVMGETPELDPQLLATLEAFFAGRGLAMPLRNRKQAWLIPSSEALPNPVGTAPGWFVRRGTGVIVSMPGVPREMTRMWREQVVPRLRERLPARAIRTITFRTIGIGESAAEQLLDDLVKNPNPNVATYAKDDGVHVRVTGVADTVAAADVLRDGAASEVASRLEKYIYGTDDTSLPSALLALLRDRKLTIGIADHGGGGRFASLLLAEPGAASLVRGAFACPDDGVEAGILAAESCRSTGASVGVGIAVHADPVEAVYEGRIAVVVAGGARAADSFPIRSSFEEIERRAGLNAADVLRRALLNAR
ncbi:MAG TPA: CinA family nicotinamide mononucleotide deamidase-related protein [Thermomicrobiales bacterium]|jgi:nicotinamide-nucleotide amidase